jgi:hypothetical protein
MLYLVDMFGRLKIRWMINCGVYRILAYSSYILTTMVNVVLYLG